MGRQHVQGYGPQGLRPFLESRQFDMRQVIVIDAERFPNVGKNTPCAGHCGTHEFIWQRIISHGKPDRPGDALFNVYDEIYQATQALPPDVRDVKVVFACAWGKHRSVALAEMSTEMLKGTGLCNMPCEHLSKEKWRKKKCGEKKCYCDRTEEMVLQGCTANVEAGISRELSGL